MNVSSTNSRTLVLGESSRGRPPAAPAVSERLVTATLDAIARLTARPVAASEAVGEAVAGYVQAELARRAWQPPRRRFVPRARSGWVRKSKLQPPARSGGID